MTLLLASVSSVDEAALVCACGADVIDLKDASKGAFGAVAPDVLRATVAAVGGRRPVSAVAGSLSMDPDVIVAAVESAAQAEVDYVKVGLFPGPRQKECIRALSSPARKTKIIGVMFADGGTDLTLVPVMAESGFAGAMLDTADKSSGRLLDHIDIAALRDFVGLCRERRLMVGLAGSLEAPDVPRLLLLEPDVLGFRGALCVRHDRTLRIDPESIRIIRELIPFDPRSAAREDPGVMKVDYRLLAARGYSADPSKDDAATDHIIVRDFVLRARVGAYASEREKPQNVRFNVDVKVRRTGHSVEGMRDVFSYDVITDGIRIIVTHEHIVFLETLAERVAMSVLAHPRAVSVMVRVEKLDVGSGGVGVEIVRARPTDVAKIQHLYPAAARPTQTKAAEPMHELIGLTVVKLGGSHAFSAHLKDWIDAIARCAGRVVVAPGGGPFADAVREVQRKMGLDDRAAHHMALLAMDQYCCALASLGRRLTKAASATAIRRVLLDGGVPVWSASRMVLGAKDIPWSWDVTSDSLAAWLAGRIGAKRVLLVKHVEPSAALVHAKDLVAQGIVDPAFPRFLGESGAEAFIAGTAEHAAAAVAMSNGGMVGARIDLR